MAAENNDLSQEQAADLARLDMLAGPEPEPDAAPGAEPEAAPGMDPVESLAGLFTVGGLVAGMLGYRRVADLWGADTCRGMAEKAVPVLVKYPWGARVLDFLATGAGIEEMALAMYAAPLALATMKAARLDAADAAARDEKQKRTDKPAGQEPAAATGETLDAQPAPGANGEMQWAA